MQNCSVYNRVIPAIVLSFLLWACQKDNDGGGTPPLQKPKGGTTWIFSYYTYSTNGGVASSKTITWKAVSEETLSGEKWLKINEQGVDTTVYYLREKSDGLYQYSNNSANLFCKDPATAGQTYNSYNAGGLEDFTVISAGTTLATNLGDVRVNFYEGRKNSNLIDEIWFNANAWIVKHQVYRKFLLGIDYYKYSALFIRDITY